jgi:hypothetical protein
MKTVVRTLPVALILAACGGGGSDDTTVSSSTPAPSPAPSPAPVAAAPVQAPPPFLVGIPVPAAPVPVPAPAPAPVAGQPTPSPAPEPPAPTPVTLAGQYPDKEMTCAQGKPMFWERKWVVGYNGGVTRFATGQLTRSISWESASLVTQQHQDAATFGAPTSDGQRTWLTVHRNGDVIGAGFNGTEDASYLRCGNPYQDGQPRGLVQQSFTCTGPQRQVENIRLDYNAKDWPYSSITVAAANTPNSRLFLPYMGVDAQGGRYVPSGNNSQSWSDYGFAIYGPTGLDTQYYMRLGEIQGVAVRVPGGAIWYCGPQ